MKPPRVVEELEHALIFFFVQIFGDYRFVFAEIKVDEFE